MKKLPLLIVSAVSVAFALPPVRPVLPSVEHLDTETVTNVPFTAWQEHLRHFTFKLAFDATPSNNVEMAFGTDGATGTTGVSPVEDGTLSPDECDLVVGWDCGAWFVEEGATGERVTAAPAGAAAQSTTCVSSTTARRCSRNSPPRSRRGSMHRAGTVCASSVAARTSARASASSRRSRRTGLP